MKSKGTKIVKWHHILNKNFFKNCFTSFLLMILNGLVYSTYTVIITSAETVGQLDSLVSGGVSFVFLPLSVWVLLFVLVFSFKRVIKILVLILSSITKRSLKTFYRDFILKLNCFPAKVVNISYVTL